MQNYAAEAKPKLWNPLQIIEAPEKHEYGVVLLNQPVREEFEEIFMNLWKYAVIRIAVDGGTVALHNILEKQPDLPLPNVISGDFDSVPAELLQHYKDKGIAVIHTPDQDDTDFTKALQLASKTLLSQDKKVEAVLAICQNGGRMDHIMGNLNTLFFVADGATAFPVYLLSSESITWLLSKGKHKISITKNLMGTCCGLVPLGCPCLSVTTTGLKWNLANGELRFGQLVSTSNTYNGSDCVTVDTDNYLLWTMETRW